jgi:hypothetical protein
MRRPGRFVLRAASFADIDRLSNTGVISNEVPVREICPDLFFNSIQEFRNRSRARCFA